MKALCVIVSIKVAERVLFWPCQVFSLLQILSLVRGPLGDGYGSARFIGSGTGISHGGKSKFQFPTHNINLNIHYNNMNGALEFVSLAKKGCLGFAKVFAVNWPLRAHGIVDIGRIHFHFHCHFDLSCRSNLVVHFSPSNSSCINFLSYSLFYLTFSFNFHCPLRFYLDKNIQSHFSFNNIAPS